MRRTYKHKRIISLILSAVLIFGMIPTAFATETTPAETTAETTAPVETTIPVVETTSAAEETTSAAEETTSAAEETTSAAEETTSAAEETTSAAEETTSAAEETTVPETTEDVEETTVPETTVETTVPETTEETVPEEVTKEADASGVTIQVSGNIPEAVELDAAYVREAGFFSFFGSSAPAFNPEIYNVISPMSTVAFAFDITLTNEDGTQWQPENGETVTVTMDVTPFEIADGTKLGIAHDHEGTITKLGEYTVESGKITFETNGFSVFYGFTVDFEYDGTWHSIAGGSGVYLSDLFTYLGINRSVDEVDYVEISNPELLSIKEVTFEGGYRDWLLQTTIAFDTEELLTVIFADGEELYINVFDAVTDNLSGTNNWNSGEYGPLSVNGADVKVTLNGNVTLKGTITIPDGKKLTITGSGSITREFDGAMFNVTKGGTLIIGNNGSAITINGNDSGSDYSGVAIECDSGKLELNNTTVTNNASRAILVKGIDAPVDVDLYRSTISYCKDKDGSAIYLLDSGKGNVDIKYSVIEHCVANEAKTSAKEATGELCAGTIRTNGGGQWKLTLEESVMRNNSTDGHGGGIYWNARSGGAFLKIHDCQFLHNFALNFGGAIFNEGKCEITASAGETSSEILTGNVPASGITGTLIAYNTAGDLNDTDRSEYQWYDDAELGTRVPSNNRGYGGGICFKTYNGGYDSEDSIGEAQLTLGNNIVIRNNKAIDGGGLMLYIRELGNVPDAFKYLITVDGAKIQYNEASDMGGGLYFWNALGKYKTELKLENGEISNNRATDGGAAYVENTGVNFGTITIANNNASNNGGALYLKQTPAAAYASTKETNVSNGSIVNNTASGFGGAIYQTGVNGQCNVSGEGTISENTAANGGGIYVAGGSKLTVSGGVISDNKAQGTPTNPATAYADAADKGVGGGIYVANNGTFVMNKVDESIPVGLYGNEADFAADDAYASGSGTTLTIPDVKGMPLSGTKFSEAEGWFLDYAIPDSEYANKSGFTADNPGRYRTTDGRKINAGTQITNGKNYYCLTLGRTPVLWISKQIQENERPDQSFRFHVKGNGIDTWVTLNPESFNDAGFAQVKIGTMPTGHFTITEDANWSWRYGFVSASAEVDQAPATSGTSITINLTDNGEEVTFVNKRDENKWLDWEHSVDNKFSPENVA